MTRSDIPIVESKAPLFEDVETRFVSDGDLLRSYVRSPKDVFLHHWRAIKEVVAARLDPGVAIFAVDETAGVAGHVWLPASDEMTHVVVGRHHLCELQVSTSCPSLSLRHLAIMVRTETRTGLQLRVRDLFTTNGFLDEHDRTLYGLDANGPLLLRAGGIHIVVLKTPDAAALPDDPDGAYDLLPPRVFEEELDSNQEPEARSASAVRDADDDERTFVTAVRGPVGVEVIDSLCEADERPTGTITIRAGDGVARRAVGPSALQRGVLIGRYDRCALGAGWGGSASPLSRVHLLVAADSRVAHRVVVGAFRYVAMRVHRSRRLLRRADTSARCRASSARRCLGSRAAERRRLEIRGHRPSKPTHRRSPSLQELPASPEIQ